MLWTVLGWLGGALNVIGYGGQIVLFGYVEWQLIRENPWGLLNPFMQLDVMFQLLFLPLFWVLLASAVAGWGLVSLAEYRTETRSGTASSDAPGLGWAAGVLLLLALSYGAYALQKKPSHVSERTAVVPESDTHDFRDLSPEETDVYMRVSARGFTQEYTATDVDSLRWVWNHYARRTGKKLPRGFTRSLVNDMRLVYEYDRELEHCVLRSLSTHEVVITPELRALRARMEERQAAPEEKLASDLRRLDSIAHGTPWVMQDGSRAEPADSFQVLMSMAIVELLGRNIAFTDSLLTRRPLEVTAESFDR